MGSNGRRGKSWFSMHLASPAIFAGLTLLAIFFAHNIVKDFSGPMLGSEDINIWGYQGYYFSENFRFWPLPHLDMVNDQLLYPYGTDNVFQTWGFEREYFWATLTTFFGRGPWVQIYYLLSVCITALGSYLILTREHGRAASVAVATAITFGNYYAIATFPYHQILASIHWVTLNILVDYVLLRRLWERRPISARLLLFKGLLLSLNFGMGLAYVAGLALTSFTLCCLTAIGILAWRRELGVESIRNAYSKISATASHHSRQCLALLALTALAIYLFVPLSAQVYIHVKSFDFSHVPTGTYWVSPYRVVLPILPKCNPWTQSKWFNDSPTDRFEGTPGLAFFVLGLLGLCLGYRHVVVVAPFFALLMLCLFFIPPEHTAIRVFPWFGFIRAGGRFTLVYPLLFCIFGLTIPAESFRRWPGRIASALLSILFLLEGATAYDLIGKHQTPCFTPDASFPRFMSAVREAPGEAVFQWPFCVAGGGGDARWLFYYNRLCGTFTLQQFHRKKELGVYFGRLHPSQVSPLWNAGWHRMFLPNSPDIKSATRQRRDFNSEEWLFLSSFYLAYDFCGVILYTDLLPPETVKGFHDRFGQPVAETTFPGAGHMEFIPKTKAQRALVGNSEGAAVQLHPAVLEPPMRIGLGSQISDDYLLDGWETASPTGRWTMANRASLSFRLPSRPDGLLLRFEAHTYESQRMEILLNKHALQTLRPAPDKFAVYEVSLPGKFLASDNRIDFVFPDAHSPLSGGESQDCRQLGAWITWIELR